MNGVATLKTRRYQFTLPLAGMVPALLSDVIVVVTGKSIRILEFSEEVDDSCPKMWKTSRESAKPILEPVARVVRLDSYAFVIVVSAFAVYLFIPITSRFLVYLWRDISPQK